MDKPEVLDKISSRIDARELGHNISETAQRLGDRALRGSGGGLISVAESLPINREQGRNWNKLIAIGAGSVAVIGAGIAAGLAYGPRRMNRFRSGDAIEQSADTTVGATDIAPTSPYPADQQGAVAESRTLQTSSTGPEAPGAA